MMSNTKLKSIAMHHAEIWKGEPWYGTNCKNGLIGITAIQATYRISNQHNIAEILYHMIQWKRFVIEKLKDNPDFNISLNSSEDWSVLNQLDEAGWSLLKVQFDQMSQTLIDHLAVASDAILKQTVPGRKYSFKNLLQGITEHEIYHLGQIILLKKIIFHEI